MLLMMRSSIMCRGGLSEEQKQTLTHCRLKHREQDTRDYGEKGKQKTKKREGVRQHLGGTNREHTAEGTKGMGIRGGGGRTQTPDICRLWEKESKIKQEVSETEKRKYTRIKGTIAPPWSAAKYTEQERKMNWRKRLWGLERLIF